jgi:hypothetical protein
MRSTLEKNKEVRWASAEKYTLRRALKYGWKSAASIKPPSKIRGD